MANQCMKRKCTWAVLGKMLHEVTFGEMLHSSKPIRMLRQRCNVNLTVPNSSKTNASKSLIHCW